MRETAQLGRTPRVIHVIPGLAPMHGGPSYSVPRLCDSLRARGISIDLFTVSDHDSSTAHNLSVNIFAQSLARTPLLQQLRSSRGLLTALEEAAPSCEAVHVHGLWLMPNVYAGRVATKAFKPLIVSPRGMVSSIALGFSPWRKKLFWSLLQRRAYAKASCWHATSAQEAEDIRKFGICAPIAVIPNGVDVPEATSFPLANSVVQDASYTEPRTFVSIGRIHPKKGLDVLVAAWGRLAKLHPDWCLRIIGPDEGGHSAELRALASSSGALNLSIEGPVFGQEKWRALASADCFVLPTLNENFGISVAEALASGCPAIVTRGAPWSGLLRERCGWWIEHGVEPLVGALLLAGGTPKYELSIMGERGRAWMKRDFGWDAIAADFADVYRWLAYGAAKPDCIA